MSSTSGGQLDSYNLLLGSNQGADGSASLQLDVDPSISKPRQASSGLMTDKSLVNEEQKSNIAQQTPYKSNINHSMVLDSPALNNADDTVAHEMQLFQPLDKKAELQLARTTTVQSEKVQAPKVNKEEAIAIAPGSSKANQDERPASSSSQDRSKVSAYARLEFENFIFFVQTLQVVLGRKSENDQSHSVDVHLGPSKAISRKHAKIFYNFGTERFELSIQGKNGAFVDDGFIERGATVPLINNSKIQIGQIVFRFVLPGMNPQEDQESSSKPLNPSDAISLKSTLYTNHNADNLEESSTDAHNLTSKDFQPINSNNPNPTPESEVAKPGATNDIPQAQPLPPSNDKIHASILTPQSQPTTAPAVKKPREKKPPRPPKPPKKVYTLEEIPEEYRTKPACSYSNLIATCLRIHGTPKGMSLAEIYKSIREIFPYYKYCPDGWQSSVRHNLSLNKAFKKMSKEGKGWLWGLDEEYCAEKERQKKKQQEAAAAKARAAQLKLEQQQQQQQQQQKLQQQRIEQQKQLQMAQAAQQQFQQQNLQALGGLGQNISGLSQSAVPLNVVASKNVQPGQALIQGSNVTQGSVNVIPLQVKVEGQAQSQQKVDPSQIPKFTPKPQPNPSQIPVFLSSPNVNLQSKAPSIQAQLAANRGIQTPGTPQPAKASPSPQLQAVKAGINPDTKKALAHLQQQLVTLSKDLRTLVDKPTISQILTQAIAMTIAQVTQAAKTRGITTDPLATLIDTNPSQLTRILTVALNAATYKVTNGRIKAPLSLPSTGPASATASRAGTPGPNTQQQQHLSNASTPQLMNPTVTTPNVAVSVPVPVSVSASASAKSQPEVIQSTPKLSQQSHHGSNPLQKVDSQTTAIPTQDPVPSPAAQQNSQAQLQKTQSLPLPSVQTGTIPQESVTPKTGSESHQSQVIIQLQPPGQLPAPVPVPVQTTPTTKTSISAESRFHPSVQGASFASVPQDSSTVNQHQSTSKAQVELQPSPTPQTSLQNAAPVLQKVDSIVTSTEDSSPVPSESQLSHPAKPYVNIPLQARSNGTSGPFPNTSTLDSLQVASFSNLSTNQSSPRRDTDSTQTESKLDSNETNQQQVTSEKQKVKAEEMNFDDLNDPEFSEVLRSLSKEGTPAVEGDHKEMNDEELNRLLSEDFSTKPLSGGQPSKRTFDEVDKSHRDDDVPKKLPKTE